MGECLVSYTCAYTDRLTRLYESDGNMRLVCKIHFEYFRKKKNGKIYNETIDETDLIVMGGGQKMRMLSSIFDRIEFSTCQIGTGSVPVRPNETHIRLHKHKRRPRIIAGHFRFTRTLSIVIGNGKEHDPGLSEHCYLCRPRNAVITLRVFCISILQIERQITK